MSLLEKIQVILQSFKFFYSESVLVFTFILIIILDLIIPDKKRVSFILFLSGIFVSSFCNNLLIETHSQERLFVGLIENGGFQIFLKNLIFTGAIVTALMTEFIPHFFFSKTNKYLTGRGEFYSILITLVLGLNIMIMSVNLLILFLSLEIISISSYLLVVFILHKEAFQASLKYILFGVFSSAISLYGMSLLYGFTGTLSIDRLGLILSEFDNLLISITFILTFAGFLFKIAAFPFQFWIAEVYETAPISIIAFFSVLPKIAATSILITLFSVINIKPFDSYILIAFISIISIISVTWGNITAIRQTSARKLLAFSSVSHTGTLILTIISANNGGKEAFLFYSTMYLICNYATFFLLQIIEQKFGTTSIENFAGLASKHPIVAIAATILMITLAGLPPTAGFTGKFFIFTSVWESYQHNKNIFLLCAIGVGVVNTVIALFYYLQIPFKAFFRKSTLEIEEPNQENIFLLVIGTIPSLLLFFAPQLIISAINSFINGN